MKKLKLSLLFILFVFLSDSSAQCDLPIPFEGNTGSNMTVMLTTAFITSLDATDENAYMVALTDAGLVVGSKAVYGVSQTTLAVWGDDSQTPEVDGALANEAVSFQLVNGTDLYDLVMPTAVSFTANGLSVQNAAAQLTLVVCESSTILGCTDSLALNYNNLATEDDATCTYNVSGCTDSTALNYDLSATLDDNSCEYDESTGDACDLPVSTALNTGTNMTVMLTAPLVISLNATDQLAYLVALTQSGLVIGSTFITGDSQTSLALFGDDTTTEDEIDGAVANETISFQLVNGTDLYDVVMPSAVSFTVNAIIPQLTAAQLTLVVCESSTILGCTDSLALNYNNLATEDDATCTYNVSGCTDSTALNYDLSATLDDNSCEYDESTGDACDLPVSTALNTGINMTVMLTTPLVISLNATEQQAYLVALTQSGLVIGSTFITGDSQTSLALFGDDSTTEDEIDGAVANETISFQLVNGTDLYDVVMPITVIFVGNGLSIQNAAAQLTLVACESLTVLGCTDNTACNFDSLANSNDGSCNYPDPYSDCFGDCINDSDNDGVCNELEVVGCTDSLAINYDSTATDSDTSCEIAGCTSIEATNYNSAATFEDDTCVFDLPFIYVTNPNNNAILTNPAVTFEYELLNSIISSDENGIHIKYSIDGADYVSLFEQTGSFTQNFDNGSHSVQFILYENNAPSSPSVANSINFTIGEIGCTNSLAANYNLNAIEDDGTCLPIADVVFIDNNTGTNHTLFVNIDGSIDINGYSSQPGDLLGVFYQHDGAYFGAGFATLTGESFSFPAWGDDATTDDIEGFTPGQSFVWAFQFSNTGNSVFLEANYATGSSSTFLSNGLSVIQSFDVMEFTDILGCTNPDYLEYNPFADIDDYSCLTLNINGCTDSTFIEFWNYNPDLLSISIPDFVANTNDGSCATLVEFGCTDSAYIQYCEDCNVSDHLLCTELVVLGCNDIQAINYDMDVNVDDGSCEFDVCIELEIGNFDIVNSTTFNIPVLSFDISNMSDEQITSPIFNLVLASDEYISVNTASISNTQINPGATITIETPITSDLSLLPASIILDGYVNMLAESFESNSIDCNFYFNEVYLLTSHIGCTQADAYNLDTLATVDDGSCIDFIQASVTVFNPICHDNFGAVSLFITGGIAPYTSPSIYTQYSLLNNPEEMSVEVSENNSVTMYGLEDGQYSIEIHDSIGNVEFYSFSIVSPAEVLVEVSFENSFLLTSSVSQGNAVFYQWLLEGETIAQANNSTHYGQEIGNYQLYIENQNGCGSYSNSVFLPTLGIDVVDDFDFTLYPNPVKSVLGINLSRMYSSTTVSITDVLGQELYAFRQKIQAGETKITLDVSDLSSGIYFMVAENGSQKTVKRFVKE